MNVQQRVDIFKAFMRLPSGERLVSEKMLDWLINRGFFTAPASTRFHGNWEGGLFDHSYNVAKRLVQMTHDNRLTWTNEESPYLVGMFHDICKIDQFHHPLTQGGTVMDSNRWEYNPDTLLKGHGEKSVMLLSQFYILTEEEITCIVYHMGAFTSKDEWPAYTNAVKTWPNVLWTHQADMLSTYADGL